MELTSRAGRVFRLDGVLMAILLGSLGINVYLGTRVKTAAAPPARPELLAAGTKAPAFEGTSLKGDKVSLDFTDKRPTLLYVFSPTCHWCEKNLANIQAIVKARRDLRIIGVNIGPKLDADAAKKQPFDEIVQPGSRTVQAYHLNGTPSTILVSNGVVSRAWTGAYAGPIADDVSKALAVTLPGLPED
jgi:cytochrome oxidase Cu insertion factor (SCO1/SenC/PrrC family)